uniref:Uncharacterized protein n=1 Tax=Oryza barthii TaxID=65489 RepID=A0A0D3G6Q1_9ORYZ
MAQVTKFTCGGFTVRICFSHLVFDEQGAARFSRQRSGGRGRGAAAGEVEFGWPLHPRRHHQHSSPIPILISPADEQAHPSRLLQLNGDTPCSHVGQPLLHGVLPARAACTSRPRCLRPRHVELLTVPPHPQSVGLLPVRRVIADLELVIGHAERDEESDAEENGAGDDEVPDGDEQRAAELLAKLAMPLP